MKRQKFKIGLNIAHWHKEFMLYRIKISKLEFLFYFFFFQFVRLIMLYCSAIKLSGAPNKVFLEIVISTLFKAS